MLLKSVCHSVVLKKTFSFIWLIPIDDSSTYRCSSMFNKIIEIFFYYLFSCFIPITSSALSLVLFSSRRLLKSKSTVRLSFFPLSRQRKKVRMRDIEIMLLIEFFSWYTYYIFFSSAPLSSCWNLSFTISHIFFFYSFFSLSEFYESIFAYSSCIFLISFFIIAPVLINSGNCCLKICTRPSSIIKMLKPSRVKNLCPSHQHSLLIQCP